MSNSAGEFGESWAEGEVWLLEVKSSMSLRSKLISSTLIKSSKRTDGGGWCWSLSKAVAMVVRRKEQKMRRRRLSIGTAARLLGFWRLLEPSSEVDDCLP